MKKEAAAVAAAFCVLNWNCCVIRGLRTAV